MRRDGTAFDARMLMARFPARPDGARTVGPGLEVDPRTSIAEGVQAPQELDASDGELAVVFPEGRGESARLMDRETGFWLEEGGLIRLSRRDGSWSEETVMDGPGPGVLLPTFLAQPLP